MKFDIDAVNDEAISWKDCIFHGSPCGFIISNCDGDRDVSHKLF